MLYLRKNKYVLIISCILENNKNIYFEKQKGIHEFYLLKLYIYEK